MHTITSTQQIYKTIGAVTLKMHIFEMEANKPPTPRSAVVFFFGGGWIGGNPKQFYPHCHHLAVRGLVAMAAEYRTHSQHGTTPFECVSDGKSALRWIREHALDLHINPQQVVAGGGSAGGHVAACTAMIPDPDTSTDDLRAVPDALVLFNPVVDTTHDRWHARFEGRAKALSPLHHVRPGLPPILIFHGTNDQVVPFEDVERFKEQLLLTNNVCELVAFEGQGHAFFNYGREENHPFEATLKAMDEFLTKLNLLLQETKC